MRMRDNPDQGQQIHKALTRFFKGEEGAANQLCRLLGPSLSRVARSQFCQDHDAGEDAIQDSLIALLAFLKRRGIFEGDLQAFANTVLRNRCRDIHRRRGRFPTVPVEDRENELATGFFDPLDAMIREELSTGLRSALRHLDDACRDLIQRLFLRDESVETLRLDLGLGSVQAVYFRKDRCLEKLRKLLNPATFDRSPIVNSRFSSHRKPRRP